MHLLEHHSSTFKRFKFGGGGGGKFEKTLTSSSIWKLVDFQQHIFQCMGNIFFYGTSKVHFKIAQKISYPYIERCVFCCEDCEDLRSEIYDRARYCYYTPCPPHTPPAQNTHLPLVPHICSESGRHWFK